MAQFNKLESFAAIDVETANFDQGSICSIGVAIYRAGKLVHTWYSLVNPECEFDPQNISIHGIRSADVTKAPKLRDVVSVIWSAFDGAIIVSHTSFDKAAFKRASQKYKVKLPRSIWLDSSMVARRTWSQFSRRGYGLKSVCDFIGHNFNHHNALEDAIACGRIVTFAMSETGNKLPEILDHCYNGDWQADFKHLPLSKVAIGTGPLSGETFVITGELSIGRPHAAQLLAELGSKVSDSVTKKTTILVVGNQTGAPAGYISTKLERALSMQASGIPITIINEKELHSIFAEYKMFAQPMI